MLRKSCKLFGNAAGKALVACAVSVALLFAFVVPAGATDAFPTTDDHSTEIATGWWWYYGVTASQVNGLVNANHARLTQVRVMDPSGPTFAVTMVADSGAYASGWWWYYGQTGNDVTALLNQNHARLISLDPYEVNGQTLFAVAMVPNTGAQDRGWWWYYGATGAQIATLLHQNNARLTELRPYVVNSQVLYAVIMISNTGADATGWEWWYNVPINTIITHVNSDHMRVIAFSVDPGGGFDAIMVASEGETWYWYYGANAPSVGQHVTAHQTRLIDISPYTSNGQLLFTEVELGDNNPPQAPINTRSAQVANYANTKGWGGGYNGAYFISSTPGAKPIVAVNSNFRYEPASSIKVLYLLYTLRKLSKTVTLNSKITYYWPGSGPPNPNACPATVAQIPANAHKVTIGAALTGMIQNSNNIYTRAFAIHWGLGPVEAMAQSLGMTGTHLNQPYIGCGFLGGVRNELTLADAAKLYAAVSNGKALSGAARTTFFKILVGGAPVATDPFGTVVGQEAAALHKSSIVTKFLAHMNVRWKAGSYTFCLAYTCVPYKMDLALTGWMSIPFMSKGKVVIHTYEFGDFVNDLVESCSGCRAQTNALNNLENVGAQAALTSIRQALATWP